MRFSGEFGIRIDKSVTDLLNKAIAQAENKRQLCLSMGISYTTLGNWLGAYDRKGEYITWEQLAQIKKYLVANGLIDGSDPKWMTPSEMRERLAASFTPAESRLLEAYRLASPDRRQMYDMLTATILAEKNAEASKSG